MSPEPPQIGQRRPERELLAAFDTLRAILPVTASAAVLDALDNAEAVALAHLRDASQDAEAVADANARAVEIAHEQDERAAELGRRNAELIAEAARVDRARLHLEKDLAAIVQANVEAVLWIDATDDRVKMLEHLRDELASANGTLEEQKRKLAVDAEALAEANVDAVTLIEEGERTALALAETARAAEAARARLERVAFSDALTGLYNRRYFDTQIVAEVERAHREGRKLSLIFLDADHFKKINDTHGHQVGDDVLRGLGSLLRTAVRRTDIAARIDSGACAARFGGEEFVMILPGADADAAAEIAERLRSRLEAQTIPGATLASDRVTASAGVAELEAWMDAAELVRRADAALYSAKRAGRNRVVIFADQLLAAAS